MIPVDKLAEAALDARVAHSLSSSYSPDGLVQPGYVAAVVEPVDHLLRGAGVEAGEALRGRALRDRVGGFATVSCKEVHQQRGNKLC